MEWKSVEWNLTCCGRSIISNLLGHKLYRIFTIVLLVVVKEIFGTNLIASGEQIFVGSHYRFLSIIGEGTLSQVQIMLFLVFFACSYLLFILVCLFYTFTIVVYCSTPGYAWSLLKILRLFYLNQFIAVYKKCLNCSFDINGKVVGKR